MPFFTFEKYAATWAKNALCYSSPSPLPLEIKLSATHSRIAKLLLRTVPQADAYVHAQQASDRPDVNMLNDNIKFVVSTSNTCFCIAGLVLGGLAAYLYYATSLVAVTLTSLTQGWIMWTMLVGLGLVFLSCLGCFGVKRQIVRVGPCGGRRLLSLYQLLLLGLLFAFTTAFLAMRTLHTQVPLLLDNPDAVYARSEQNLLVPYFNRLYFKTRKAAVRAHDGGAGSFNWFADWTRQSCPLSMDVGTCTSCGTDGDGGTSVPYTDGCCPRDDLCTAGNLDACPYHRCRLGVARFLSKRLGALQKYLNFLLILQLIVLISTCMLICYNPRDSFAELLAKTGVVIMHERTDFLPKDEHRTSRILKPPTTKKEQPSHVGVKRSQDSAIASPSTTSPVVDIEGKNNTTMYGGRRCGSRRSPAHMV